MRAIAVQWFALSFGFFLVSLVAVHVSDAGLDTAGSMNL
jgi:hypothetical protein